MTLPRVIFGGKPALRPLFGAGLYPTAAERREKEARAFAWAWHAVHGEAMTLSEARAKLIFLGRMGRSSTAGRS